MDPKTATLVTVMVQQWITANAMHPLAWYDVPAIVGMLDYWAREEGTTVSGLDDMDVAGCVESFRLTAPVAA